MKQKPQRKEIKREDFADGSSLVTYHDGSVLIVESKLARSAALGETHSAHYDEPPPPPPQTDRKNSR